MAWVDGVDYSTGQLISATIWNNYLGAAGDIDLTAPGVVTAEGDMVYATANNTITRLAKGTDNHVMTMDGNVPNWEAAAGGGKILQVQYMTYSTNTTNNTSTFAASGLTDAITCAATSSKVLVMGTMHGLYRTGGGAALVNYIGLRITRGGSAISSFTDYWGYSTGSPFLASTSWHYVDSPSSTSELTYAIEFASTANNATIKVNQENTTPTVSMLVLMEIGA